jgi:outer membrane protein assembly factor BamB
MTAITTAYGRRGWRLVTVTAGAAALSMAVLPGAGVAATTPSACSPDWPMYQHDAARTGAACGAQVTETNVATLVAQWQAPTANPVTATPTIAGGRVFVGDAGGIFYAFNRVTGAQEWTFNITSNSCHDDRHQVDFGGIPSTAAVTTVNGRQLVILGGGGTLYALDATSGSCVWSQDLDPANPQSEMEIESSPAVVALHGHGLEVFVGSDSNEDPGHSAPTGVQAFDAATGALKWKYEPEAGRSGAVVHSLDAPSNTNGCGDVWSSPAVDPAGAGGHGLVVFGIGNCPTLTILDGIVALDATTGAQRWRFEEPPSDYTSTSFQDGGDTDFGSSPILTGTGKVIEASKSGYVYAVDESSGAKVWSTQAAQPGQVGDTFGGAVGGFIGSAALGTATLPVAGEPQSTWFAASAIPTPLSSESTPTTSSAPAAPVPDTSLACVDEGHGFAPTAATPACDPLRAASLHAVDALTGQVRWQEPVSLPSYSAVTYAGGVVFAPSTTAFELDAYDAGTGAPLWAFPLGAAVASGAAVAGPAVYVGSGISEGGTAVPGINGVWAFCLAGSC